MSFSLTIIGPPAAGKSSLTKELRSRLPRLSSFSVRSHFSRAVREGTQVGLAAKPYVEQGAWIPDELVTRAVGAAFGTGELALPVIFEGMPGNNGQARLLDALLAERRLPLVTAVYMDIDLSICERRSRTRRVCLACDDGSWPADDDPDRPGLCAQCSGPITSRPADEPGLFRRRLETFRREGPMLRAAYPADRLLVLNATRPTSELADAVMGSVKGFAGGGTHD
jgi:adenylate kinase